MSTIFTKIIQKKLPAYIIAEDNNHIAFLDIAPIAYGHTLVVPKKEVDYLFALEDATLSSLMLFAKKVAQTLEKVIKCKRIGMCVLGLEVPHTHLHLVPIQQEQDLNLRAPKRSFSSTTFKELSQKLHKTFIQLQCTTISP